MTKSTTMPTQQLIEEARIHFMTAFELPEQEKVWKWIETYLHLIASKSAEGKAKEKIKTSVVHNTNYPEHEHQMVIWDSYEVYATCKKCGFHDWEDLTISEFEEKYPDSDVVNIDEMAKDSK